MVIRNWSWIDPRETQQESGFTALNWLRNAISDLRYSELVLPMPNTCTFVDLAFSHVFSFLHSVL